MSHPKVPANGPAKHTESKDSPIHGRYLRLCLPYVDRNGARRYLRQDFSMADWRFELEQREKSVALGQGPFLPTDRKYAEWHGRPSAYPTVAEVWTRIGEVHGPLAGDDRTYAESAHYAPSAWEVMQRVYAHHVEPRWGKATIDRFGDDQQGWSKCFAGFTAKGASNRATANLCRTIVIKARTLGMMPISWSPAALEAWDQYAISAKGKLDASAIWSWDEAMALRAASADKPRICWAWPGLMCALGIGARISEILAMRWSDIDLTTNRCSISKQLWKSKGERTVERLPKHKSSGVVAIFEDLVPILVELRATRLAEIRALDPRPIDPEAVLMSERVIRNSMGRTPTRQSFLSAVYKLADNAGVSRKSIHAGRHHAATALIPQIGLAGARAQLRHKHMSTTQIYEHVDPAVALKDAQTVRFGSGK